MEENRILVADDDEFFREYYVSHFESLGYIVDAAENNRGVEELLGKHNYALIFCDNSMPMDEGRPSRSGVGIELLTFAKGSERHRETPFVLHTADDMESTKEAVKRKGGIYLYKGAGGSNLKALAELLKK